MLTYEPHVFLIPVGGQFQGDSSALGPWRSGADFPSFEDLISGNQFFDTSFVGRSPYNLILCHVIAVHLVAPARPESRAKWTKRPSDKKRFRVKKLRILALDFRVNGTLLEFGLLGCGDVYDSKREATQREAKRAGLL